jgi:diguanylate cyclase (GGDEF)-like protein
MIVVAFDITDRKKLEERLQQQAFTDGLTGLANRALFLDRVGHVLARRRSKARDRMAVLFLDVDDFKTVNDSMGHIAGDELLVVLGQRLKSVVRPNDTAARLGGDEFAILLEDTGQSDAEVVAQRVLAELARPVHIGGREVHISVSIGIAVPDPARATSSAELLRDADLAMYRAKTMLQGSYAVYQPGMHEAALRRLELKADLQQALESDGLELEYQPIFELERGTPVGAEALLRWRHPQRGAVPALEIVALAEATGLMMPLSRWILGRATADARRWAGASATTPLFVSVNASARELLDPAYAGLVAETLAQSGMEPHSLAIEITENDLMQDTEAAIAGLRGLKKLGVRLAIDDFGTGYSSLAYLARFPLDVLKIDRAFVSTRSSGHDGAIARAIIDLAASLDLVVIAEGIEQDADRTLMLEMGATWGQGFHLGRPTSAAQISALFAGKPRPRRTRAARGTQTRPALMGGSAKA